MLVKDRPKYCGCLTRMVRQLWSQRTGTRRRRPYEPEGRVGEGGPERSAEVHYSSGSTVLSSSTATSGFQLLLLNLRVWTEVFARSSPKPSEGRVQW